MTSYTHHLLSPLLQGTHSDVVRDKSWQDEDLGSEDSSDDGSEGEGEGEVPGRTEEPVGSYQLSDQLQLLSPTSKPPAISEDSNEMSTSLSLATASNVADLYATVNKKKKAGNEADQDRVRTGSDPTPATNHSPPPRRGSSQSLDSGDRGLEDSLKEKSGQFISSSQPPWIEMVC